VAQTSPVGLNLGGIADWSTELSFMNLMHTARPWFSQYVPAYAPAGVYIWDLGVASPQSLSEEGWPLELAQGRALGTLLARYEIVCTASENAPGISL
jgi:hypothetical protein